ncbi:1-(5-phosphoribosyl)-5-[(5-phosphoribosylamino)methylideneamino]imidazole-4-carboxamide isomerase [Enterorhabdus mucosicola]|uniref:1-(5-phosphoribosyl)-5-[(5-phosphoribosylamino)methylideneamino] imidazole-4-carboxamide isomerase n=1 Tax=Adlercreutzia mucosicola TaxID=580026 RepID=A0A6N8JRD4_9ACTN|nr:1-(5-phosphoribosyl)-5-[(5-phosphoribosylamino)methylideneamino]imidazole-4-carboxamide isomerase [Adlercreutzia mucosicola]MVX61316.1 1-(5-phosphoribosyl)-5-[(5-phosphoribosylamino)methylideneamino]imidazole-4-carboxamide isomerase [Adlercreutzia mucosicola]
MYLLPAIDILDGRAVRLARGDYDAVTVYHDDPALQAQLFEEDGASWIHVVDLNGAKSGNPDNIEVVRCILARTKLKVEVGGGVRSLEVADRLLDAGATRVILGTALVRDPDFAQAAIEKFGADALVAGIDAKAGEAAVAGWTEGSGVAAADLARRMAGLGYEHIVYTDIARDGMQTGVENSAYARMAAAFGNPVIVSGGIATAADIAALAPIADAVEGVIAGRAIYEGTLSVADGVAACEGTYRVSDQLEAEERPLTIEDLEA